MRTIRTILIGSCVAIAYLAGAAPAQDTEPNQRRTAFPLEVVSDVPDLPYLGHPCNCTSEADLGVAYPEFVSTEPLYGVLFVDNEVGRLRSGRPHHFAIDESVGTGTGFDRLYIDLDGDGSLVDETPIAPLNPLPEGGLFSRQWTCPPVWFDYVTFSSQDSDGLHSVKALARLGNLEDDAATLHFMVTEKRRGTIEIGPRRYAATLVNNAPLSTRWDRPGITAQLDGRDGAVAPNWTSSKLLMAMHRFDGTWWRLSATAKGDQFIVEPYAGPLGTLALGSGRQFVWSKGLGGSLLAKDRLVPVGTEADDGTFEPVSRCQLPVGDYTPNILNIRYGLLTFSVSASPQSDVTEPGESTLTYPLKIRADRACVLDFSKRAEVLFTNPAPSARFRRGSDLTVLAFLVDPQLDLRIFDLQRKAGISGNLVGMLVVLAAIPIVLWRLGRKAWRRSVALPLLAVTGLFVLAAGMGVRHAAERAQNRRNGVLTLEPKVAICRADGEIVAEGVMPFG